MKLKKIAFAIIAIFMLMVAVPFLIPMSSYVRQIEQLTSEKTGVPVTLGALHIALLPSPRANISEIVVGKAAEIKVSRVSAVLDMTSLLGKTWVISRLEVDSPELKQAAFDIISALSSSGNDAAAPSSVTVRKINVHAAKLVLEGTDVPLLDANISMAENNALEQAVITTTDEKLEVNVRPKDQGYTAHVEAKQWTPLAGLSLVLDTLKADVKYSGRKLDVPSIDVGLYRGTIKGSARLEWEKDWRLDGKFKTSAIELGDASKIFTKTTKVSGRISGNGSFTSSAKGAGQLMDRLVLDYNFNVANGILHGMDLVQAASLLVRQGQFGGETRFDELSGRLHTSGKSIELRQLKVTSGLLAAQGGVKISPDKKLAGQVEAEIKKGVSLVSVPLEISGTLDQPSVMPTKAALAGAVMGTAVLGPAVGTSLGIKAGGAVDKLKGLFGGKQ